MMDTICGSSASVSAAPLTRNNNKKPKPNVSVTAALPLWDCGNWCSLISCHTVGNGILDYNPHNQASGRLTVSSAER